MITTVPFESAVVVKKPTLVGWCQSCQLYEEPFKKGALCWFDHEWKLWAWKKHNNGEARALRKRLMWICKDCDHAYETRAGLLNHEHEWS